MAGVLINFFFIIWLFRGFGGKWNCSYDSFKTDFKGCKLS